MTRHVSRGKPIPDEIMAFPFLSAVTTPFSPSCSTVATFSFQETHLVFLPSGSFSISRTNGFFSSPIFTVAVLILMPKLLSAYTAIPPISNVRSNVRGNAYTFFLICIFPPMIVFRPFVTLYKPFVFSPPLYKNV